MDDKPGNVIDGTARARQWRRSRSKARADEDGSAEIRSDAPKSFASSLLVPADMVHGVLGPAAEQEDALGDALDGEHDETDDARAANATPPERRNPFLAPEAAVVATTDPAKRHSKHRLATALIARVITRASTSRRHGRTWPVASPNQPARPAERALRIAGALGLGAVLVAAAVLVTQNHAGPLAARSSGGGGQSLASLDRLKGLVLSVGRPPVTQRERRQSHPAPRLAARHRANHAHRHTTMPVSSTAVVARYTPARTTAASSTATPSAPVQAGSSSSAASATPSASAPSTPTTTKHAPARAFGVGGVLGPGSSPDG